MLHDLGYSLQANSKTMEGTKHPDRNAQFEYLNRRIKRQLQQHLPVISVDAKKKELVENFNNNGRELRPRGDPEKVRVHDFIIAELGRANPYGIYDIARNTGWVSVGRGSRYGGVRGPEHPALVELDGAGGVSAGHATADYGGCGRQQRGARAALEVGAAEVGRRNWLTNRGESPASGNQQVEQDRAPFIFLYQPELAWQSR